MKYHTEVVALFSVDIEIGEHEQGKLTQEELLASVKSASHVCIKSQISLGLGRSLHWNDRITCRLDSIKIVDDGK